MKDTLTKTEVLIVGAGVAGASLAIRLAKQGLDVTIIEKDRFPRHKLCGEFVSPECLSHFEELGVLDAMLDIGGDAIHETRFYSESGKSVGVPSEWFSKGESGALGISRSEMDSRLLENARLAGAKVLEENRVTAINTAGGRIKGVTAKGAKGKTTRIEADLVVDATGRARVLSRLVERNRGRKPAKKQIGHVAFKAHFKNVRLEHGVCEIYFFRGGYGGLNFVEGGNVNHCFLIDSKVAREFNGDADLIVEEVIFKNKRVARALVGAEKSFEWIAVSVEKFGRQDPNDLENLVAIGDAKAFIDPFTGSGMLMGLESSALLADAVRQCLPGKPRRLKERFEQAHRKATRRRLFVCSIFRHLAYSPRLAGLVISAAGLSGRFLKHIAAMTRPARSH